MCWVNVGNANESSGMVLQAPTRSNNVVITAGLVARAGTVSKPSTRMCGVRCHGSTVTTVRVHAGRSLADVPR